MMSIACGRPDPILLFNGTGTSPNDVAAVESILRSSHLEYATANSARLKAMGDLRADGYRLLIVPGGNFEEMGKSLTPRTAARLRGEVQGGLNYLGICAGAFLAGDLPQFNGLNLTDGRKFGFYSAEVHGIRKSAVAITIPGQPTLDQYWEDGPELSGWGTVVGRYPDGTPAVVEGSLGSGWIVLTGFHPEAPGGWRRGLSFNTPVEADHAYAARLIEAALIRSSLLKH